MISKKKTKAMALAIFAVAILLTSGLAMVTAIHADNAASATSSDWPMFHHDLAHYRVHA